MRIRRGRIVALALVFLLPAAQAFAQQETKKRKAASLDGTTGLFRAWDAETLRAGEFNLSFGAGMYHRDPGQMRFVTVPVAAAFGIHDRFEVFASIDGVRKVTAENIRTYRVINGRLPVPSWTPLGAARFNNEAPFMDVPKATGLGDFRFGAKFNLFSERRHDGFAMSLVGFMKAPLADSFNELDRGLGNGEIEGGWGVLTSKTAGRFAKLHLNTMVNWVRDPKRGGIEIADLQHEFWYRGGAQFPANGSLQAIAEVDGKTYFGSRTLGLNPRSPVDVILGVRIYPAEWISVGAGYRASLNHIPEETTLRHFPADTHGFVAQIAFGRRINEPPTVTCAISNATIKQDETTTIRANAVDPDGDPLTITWTTTGGKVTGSGDTATFDATGVAPGKYTVTATVSDGKHQATCSVDITVVKKNLPPTVSCEPSSASVTLGESTTIRANATDPNNDRLTYSWTINGERVAADGPTLTFGSTGRQPGRYTITVTVSDGEATATCSSTVTVNPRPNRQPTIECLTTSVDVEAGGTVQLRVRASDPDGDPVNITWSATGGTVTGSGDTATFSAAGLRAGNYTVTATVDDGRGGRASCNVTVNVTERVTFTTRFAPGSARVDNVAKAVLDDVALRMQNDPRLRANIIGYTDNTRRDRGLGLKRAQNVAAYLQKKGIDQSRLTVTDGGTNNPIGDNKTVEGRKQNRRVEIEVTTSR
jgi:outer membrane protein OmpA-like peptidoglycan-associated protein